MRPKINFLDDGLIGKIIDEAIKILCTLGVEIQNDEVLKLLSDHGAEIDIKNNEVIFTEDIIQKALECTPESFKLFDVLGNETHDLSGFNVSFTPGSSALNILDGQSDQLRKPNTADYVDYLKVVSQLKYIASQSTAFIPADVHEQISDSYRLLLSLLYCEKPVVTGAFSIKSFEVMKNMQLAVRGNEAALKQKPLTVFSCCPTSPLKWSKVTAQNVMDCARYFIPVEFVTMPLAGFIAPVTLTGTLIQHTAETFSGIIISQLTNPGAPILYGGSPAIFDVRYESTPMGAIETMMIDCAYNEIGKYLNIPTQAYISLSDAKQLDAQSGLESGMGATLAALSGINNISGPGMLDFESCISLEKLVLDNEICGMSLKLIEGITPKDDFPALPIFQELLKEKHLLIAKHTRKFLRQEHFFPGSVIDRANRARWQEEGSLSLKERAAQQVKELLDSYQPSRLPEDVQREMIKLMEKEVRNYGQKLPEND